MKRRLRETIGKGESLKMAPISVVSTYRQRHLPVDPASLVVECLLEVRYSDETDLGHNGTISGSSRI